jgi:hypothetical protein
MTEDPELRAALARFAERRRRTQDHISAEDLEAFHWGDLDAASEETVRDHLSVCPECVALLRELDELPSSLAPAEPPGLLRWPRRHEGRGLYTLAAAAALLAVAVGLAAATWGASRHSAGLEERVGRLEKELDHAGRTQQRLAGDLDRTRRELSSAREKIAAVQPLADAWLRPHVNTPVEQLRATHLRGPAEGAATMRLPAGADVLTLILEDPQDKIFPAYRLEVRSSLGKTVGNAVGLVRTRYRSFVVTLPRQLLPSSRLGFHLYGVRRGGSQEKEIAAYAIEIVR